MAQYVFIRNASPLARLMDSMVAKCNIVLQLHLYLLFFYSDSGYVCLDFYYQDKHVIQMRYGESKFETYLVSQE